MFDESLERMIWRVLSRFADLSDARPAVSPAVPYALADGVFQHALIRQVADDEGAAGWLIENIRLVLPSLLAAGGAGRQHADVSPAKN